MYSIRIETEAAAGSKELSDRYPSLLAACREARRVAKRAHAWRAVTVSQRLTDDTPAGQPDRGLGLYRDVAAYRREYRGNADDPVRLCSGFERRA